MGDLPYGKCDRCGRTGPLSIRYRHYTGIQCECCGPYHFDRMEVCKDCNEKDDNELFDTRTTIHTNSSVYIVNAKFLMNISEQMKKLATDDNALNKLKNYLS